MSKLGDLIVRLKLQHKDYQKGLKGAKQDTEDFSASIGKAINKVKLAWAAVGAGVVKVAGDMAKAAAEAQGIANQFQKIADPALLDNLRKATRNTVSDVELMKAAIKAQNFNIPLKNLATYFEFATTRAIQTGESVDYLVDSIITGLGRESVMILDNLGVSAAAIKEEMAGGASMVEALGTIIQRDLGNAGETASTAAVNIAQVKAAWDNLKVTIGNSQVIQKALLTVTNLFSNLVRSIDDVAAKGGISAHNAFVELDEEVNYLRAIGRSEEQILNTLNARLSELKSQLGSNAVDNFFKNGFKTSGIKRNIAELEAFIATFRSAEQTVNTSSAGSTTSSSASTGAAATAAVVPALADVNLSKIDRDLLRWKTSLEKSNATDIELDFDIDLSNLSTATDDIDTFVSSYMAEVHEIASLNAMLEEAVVESMSGAITAITEALMNIEDADASAILAALMEPFANTMVQLGEMLLMEGIGILAFKQALSSLNPYVAIAAGAALIALGAALTAGIKALGQGGGGASAAAGSSEDFARSGGNDIKMEPVQVEVTGKIKGQDIELSQKKYNDNRRR